MIKSTISDIKKIVLEILLILSILVALLYGLLLHGVTMENLHLFGIKCRQLYLKLDKKLILSADKISLLAHPSSQDGFPKELLYVQYIPRFFQKIELQNIRIGKESAKLLYDKGRFFLTTPTIKASATINGIDEKISIHIQKLLYTPYNLFITGFATLTNNHLLTTGHYDFEGIKGAFLLQKSGSHIFFKANSKPFVYHNLVKAFAHIRLNQEIKRWSYQNIKAKVYRLHSLLLQGDISHLGTKNITALITAQDVRVRFSPKLPAAKVEKVTMKIAHDNIHFTLTHPMYEGKNLQGSYVTIHSLSYKSFIDIFLHLKTPFDSIVRRSIQAFGITIPLLQKKGVIDARVLIRIALRDLATNISGTFKSKNSLFELGGVQLFAKRLHLKLQKSHLFIKDSLLVLPSIARANVNGYFNFSRGYGEFKLANLTIHIQKKGATIAELTLSDKLILNLTKKRLFLPKLHLLYDLDKQVISIDQLQKYQNAIPLLAKLHPRKASLLYYPKTKDFRLLLSLPSTPLIKKNHPLKDLLISGNLNSDDFSINDLISFHINKEITAFIHDLGIKLDALSFTSKQSLQKPINATLKNITLLYKGHKLPVPSGIFKQKAQKTLFVDRLKKGKLRIEKDQNLTIKATNLSSAIWNDLLGKSLFYKGSYNLFATGKIQELHGRFTIKEGYLRNFKLLNNFFAFLNAIPSLVTLSNPGFSKDGLPIYKGNIEFIYKDGILLFNAIDLHSTNLTIKGYGFIDTKRKNLDIWLRLQTLKKISKLLNHIPIAGYILLGDNGTISTGVHINGTLDNPHFSSELPKESLSFPFKLIKRTFQLPWKILH